MWVFNYDWNKYEFFLKLVRAWHCSFTVRKPVFCPKSCLYWACSKKHSHILISVCRKFRVVENLLIFSSISHLELGNNSKKTWLGFFHFKIRLFFEAHYKNKGEFQIIIPVELFFITFSLFNAFVYLSFVWFSFTIFMFSLAYSHNFPRVRIF